MDYITWRVVVIIEENEWYIYSLNLWNGEIVLDVYK